MNKIIRIVLSAFLVAALLFGVCIAPCSAASTTTLFPVNAKEFQGNHYLVVRNSEVSWQEAKEACEELGGHLVTITTKEESNFLLTLINSTSDFSYYMGGYRFCSDGWEWITGEPWGFTDWRYDQPDNVANSQAFLRIVYSSRYGWHYDWDDIDGNTSESTGYICEWEGGDTPLSIEESNGHYYAAIDLRLTWTEARQYCQDLGGHLATVTSEEEQGIIEEIATNRDRYWIGGTYSPAQKKWLWITNETFSYSNFGANYVGDGTKYYICYNTSTKVWDEATNSVAIWNRVDGLGTTGFICEWESADAVADINVRGDANLDGKVTIKDATVIQRYLAKLTTLNSKAEKASDADCDGTITIKDVTQIQKYLADIIYYL